MVLLVMVVSPAAVNPILMPPLRFPVTVLLSTVTVPPLFELTIMPVLLLLIVLFAMVTVGALRLLRKTADPLSDKVLSRIVKGPSVP